MNKFEKYLKKIYVESEYTRGYNKLKQLLDNTGVEYTLRDDEHEINIILKKYTPKEINDIESEIYSSFKNGKIDDKDIFVKSK